MTTLTDAALSALQTAQVDGLTVQLTGQLDRPTYKQVNDVLTRLGGRWNSGKKRHLFVDDPSAELAVVVRTGEMPPDPKKEQGWYRTPDELAKEIVRYHTDVDALPEGATVLEPSAGDGSLVAAILNDQPEVLVTAVEIIGKRSLKIDERAERVVCSFDDWAEQNAHRRFDAVVMNPPFTLPGRPNAWIDHIRASWSLLAPGGRLTAIVPKSFEFRTDKAYKAIRQLVKDNDGMWQDLPGDAFAESGTGIHTIVVSFYKPEQAGSGTPTVDQEETPMPAAVQPSETQAAEPEPAAAPAEEVKERITSIRLDKIVPNPDQPRKVFDRDKLEELKASIRASGLLQEIVVRPAGNGTYQIIAGERRWRACQELGLEKVRCKIRYQDDEGRAYIDSMAENLIRADMTLMEEVRGYARLRDEFGYTVADIAKLLGRSAALITWRLGLMSLIPEAIEALEKGLIKQWFGVEVAKLPSDMQSRLLTRYLRGEFKSETDAIEVAKALLVARDQTALFGSPEEDTPEARAERKKATAQVTSQLDRVVKLCEVLEGLTQTDPKVLRAGMGERLAVVADHLAQVGKLARRAEAVVRQARAVQAVLEDKEESQGQAEDAK